MDRDCYGDIGEVAVASQHLVPDPLKSLTGRVEKMAAEGDSPMTPVSEESKNEEPGPTVTRKPSP